MRISRPLYESLPYLYIAIGLIAFGASFVWRVAEWSGVLAAFGLVAILGGLVLALRRRDYRIQKRHYGAEFDEGEGERRPFRPCRTSRRYRLPSSSSPSGDSSDDRVIAGRLACAAVRARAERSSRYMISCLPSTTTSPSFRWCRRTRLLFT